MFIFSMLILGELIEVSIFGKIISAFGMIIKEQFFRSAIVIYCICLDAPSLNLGQS